MKNNPNKFNERLEEIGAPKIQNAITKSEAPTQNVMSMTLPWWILVLIGLFGHMVGYYFDGVIPMGIGVVGDICFLLGIVNFFTSRKKTTNIKDVTEVTDKISGTEILQVQTLVKNISSIIPNSVPPLTLNNAIHDAGIQIEIRDLNARVWYRAMKVVFVIAFICAEMGGLYIAHSLASESPRGYSYAELIQMGAKPVEMTRAEYRFVYDVDPSSQGVEPVQMSEQSLITRAVLSNMRPAEGTAIDEEDFLNLKSNVEKMLGDGISNQDVNTYVGVSFQKLGEGYHIQPLTKYSHSPKTYKYSLLERVGIYFLTPIIILMLFILMSRIFFYIFRGEKFFALRLLKK